MTVIDIYWKDIAIALLGAGWIGICWWCKRIQAHADAVSLELSRIRESLPRDYVQKTENTEQLRRIEDKLDRLVERMLP